MSSLMSALGVDKLSPAEQLHLVEEILESLAHDSSAPLTEAQRQELRRRVALLDANQTTVSSWEEVEARVLARLSQ